MLQKIAHGCYHLLIKQVKTLLSNVFTNIIQKLFTHMLLAGILLLLVSLFCLFVAANKKRARAIRITNGFLAAFSLFTGFVFIIFGMIADPEPQITRVVEPGPRADPIGMPAPEFSFLTLTENNLAETSLTDYEGSIVVLNFWATWCAPCVKEMPDLSKLAETYPDDVVVVCVSDETEQEVRPFLNRFESLAQDVGILKPDTIIPSEFYLFETIRPITYIIDREGNIHSQIRGARTFEEFEMAVLEVI